ncbi:sensor histidine kinase [Neorhodopirellula pilleata]|uniref:histidine kinase n=1 Tax=Neorhodopirellula pilleata TaxID=2714738 RepID=A0A5C5ZV96_9BACT|nr:ATP-binding protein [Neorhodopirellula pilleata]TWT91484.1 Signal transduction histidine-protein kinase BarA [Neorhodopirellula pilleata]
MLRFLQSLFSSMSLERKCLLFFGSALVVLMCGAFCVVLLLADGFVSMTTQQQARDAAATEMMLLHANAIYLESVPDDRTEIQNQKIEALRSQLLSKEIEFEILGLDDPQPFDNLATPRQPESSAERAILEQLEPLFRARLAARLREDQSDSTASGLAKPFNLADDAAMSRIGPGNRPLFQVIGPVNKRYTYYEPVFITQDCIACHTPMGKTIALSSDVDAETRAAELPYRVKRVSMPDDKILNDTTQIRAIVVAMAMLIVAVTLFVLHAIVRYLVLQPLLHLRDVSDAITHGDTNQRAVIDTEDEFRELADAFNRMLRHLTETQTQLESVNRELDGRVDQFAQLNLQLYEANRLKTDFLANMSHELRTPLNSIIGFSEVLSGIDSLNDKQRRYATNIQKSGRLLLEMINDILDLAKVEAGKMEVRRSEFKLARLINAQCDMIQSLSEDKNISLSIDVGDDLPLAFQDPNKLGQIINNLLSNAIKFTPEGGMITVKVQDLNRDRFRLSITDTGVGIAEEDQPIIFQKFRQSKKVLDGDGLTREFAGTGLGLSIVKELAILLGGEVDFQSELGRGSTFWVTLPYRLSDHHEDDMPPVISHSTAGFANSTTAATT